MDNNSMGANEFTVEELEALFHDESQTNSPTSNENTTDAQEGGNETETDKSNDVEKTKAFATRLRESTEKARREEREAIAKSFGYSSYDDMIKSRERQVYEDKGLDPDEISPIVEELVKQRLESDPRMQELTRYRNQQAIEFGKKELAELTELTGGKITKLEQLPKNVLEQWQKEGSLTDAYLKLEGKKLITQMRSEQSKGSTEHLGNPNGSSPTITNQRPLTSKEKEIWKYFNPSISDEELNKKMVDK